MKRIFSDEDLAVEHARRMMTERFGREYAKRLSCRRFKKGRIIHEDGGSLNGGSLK